MYNQTEAYGTVTGASVSGVSQVYTTHQIFATNTPGHHGVHAAHTGAQASYDHYQSLTSPQTVSADSQKYPPPTGPPPHWRPQQQQPPPPPPAPALPYDATTPVPGSPLLAPQVAAAVEVATRYLEAVNKAVTICIELNVM
jgi:hypothetical protein